MSGAALTGQDLSLSAFIAFTWSPPEVNRKVQEHAWLAQYGAIRSLRFLRITSAKDFMNLMRLSRTRPEMFSCWC
jgi:hypothetical protein